ncbi:MAG: transposase [Calditrichia bacterium]|nr:transposase [Calditrichota bacterium]MCB9067190.1 transposase [Calditrichia bacterium]
MLNSKKKEENDGLRVKVDSYVVESNVHFSSDVNLLWDAGRKCLDIVGRLVSGVPKSGWRKHQALRAKLKGDYQKVSRIMSRGGRRREARLIEGVCAYLERAATLSLRLKSSDGLFSSLAEGSLLNELLYRDLRYYEEMLDKHISLLRRRVIHKEVIPHEEKVFSLFEAYTRWINKGKSGGRIELGLPVGIASDQHGFILDHFVMERESDVDVAVPLGKRLVDDWGRLSSLSFDRGYWSPENYRRLCYRVDELVMPKKGGTNKAEQERESRDSFVRLRCEHAGVESDINALEHHGLNRCPDKGLNHFRRYVALGILSLNLHRLGNLLLLRDRQTTAHRTAA